MKHSESKRIKRPINTPEHIDSLQPNEVFVFGSNLDGHHGGGAAWTALKRFGAIYEQRVGLQGHKSSKTTEIYTHVTEKSLKNIISPFDTL